MREILFRGKRTDTGEWVEGDLFRNDNVQFPITCIGRLVISKGKYTDVLYIDGQEIYEVIPETVGQYTGLKDKNGVKIFEGDVIEQSGCRWVVGFQNSAFVALEEDGSMQFVLSEQYIFDWGEKTWVPPDYFEVIGNIHDNPELLEVGE